MKSRYALIPFAVLACVAAASAETTYRCDNNYYTNDRNDPAARNCKAVAGGNVTVVQGTKVNGNASGGTSVATAPQLAPRSSGQRVDAGDQKARDSEARSILESELRKAEARQAELEKEYNNGQPELLGPEHKNHQKYLERVSEMKAALDRNTRDIEGIKRELTRTMGSSAPASASTAAK